jgi:uncharacterized 2Fe-2S/4Fe-4S cluster protein (DUF4445 family)
MITKRVLVNQKNISVLEFLASKNIIINSSCNGRGVCKLCNVKIISGNFLYNEKVVLLNSSVPACKTFGQGVVEITLKETTPILDYWTNINMPISNKCVIGIDIGSTTIVAAKFFQGKILATQKLPNPQAIYGFGNDVITRIAHCNKEESFLKQASLLQNTIDEVINNLTIDNVSSIGIAGNPVMTAFYHQVNPKSLGTYPYNLEKTFYEKKLHPKFNIPIITVPNIASFLGGDALSGWMQCKQNNNTMLLDIGTNCEIIYQANNQLYGLSTPAGPAFERAYQAKMPSEVCSDLANGIKNNLLQANGLLSNNQNTNSILSYLTQEDISQLILAKGAVASGIAALEKETLSKAKTIYIAGALGQNLDVGSAITIGLLPKDRTYIKLGNSSLAGAIQIALEESLAQVYNQIAKKIKVIELNNLPYFSTLFSSHLKLHEF